MDIPAPLSGCATMQEVWDFYREDLAQVETRITEALPSQVPLLNEIGRYILNSGGKRIRPLLILSCARLSDYRGPGLTILAAAVEFIHTATLLHDDVIDEADMRRGRRAARLLWSNQASILAGDYLYTQALCQAVSLNNQGVNLTLSEACRLMTEGETLQLSCRGDLNLREEEYLKIIRCKTGALISAACRLGAILGGLPAEVSEVLGRFGLRLGMAYQVTDDTLDYVADGARLGKTLGKDLQEGKLTLPLLHLLREGGPRDREQARALLRQPALGERDLKTILGLMEARGSIRYARDVAAGMVEQAKKELLLFKPSFHRDALGIIADYVVYRDH